MEENVLYRLGSVSSSQLLYEWKMDEIVVKVKKPKVKLELNRKKNRDFVLACSSALASHCHFLSRARRRAGTQGLFLTVLESCAPSTGSHISH